MTAPAILDRDHLTHMTGGDSALQAELFELFRTQAALWQRLFTPNAPLNTWRDAAHSCKGTAKGLGLWRLAEACTIAEDLGREGLIEGQDVQQALSAVRAELVIALDALADAGPMAMAANDA
jgi:HPt (histidine-containing phosphotransfer) domain-containing protein